MFLIIDEISWKSLEAIAKEKHQIVWDSKISCQRKQYHVDFMEIKVFLENSAAC